MLQSMRTPASAMPLESMRITGPCVPFLTWGQAGMAAGASAVPGDLFPEAFRKREAFPTVPQSG